MPALPTFTTLPTQLSAPSRRLRRHRPKRSQRWPAHLVSLAVLLLVYGAGYSAGRDAALSRVAPHPACHPNLKP